jgi:hypothetical protein
MSKKFNIDFGCSRGLGKSPSMQNFEEIPPFTKRSNSLSGNNDLEVALTNINMELAKASLFIMRYNWTESVSNLRFNS